MRKNSSMAGEPALSEYRLVFVGDESVGKTSIITNFMNNKFDPIYHATLSVQFLSTTVYTEDTVYMKHRPLMQFELWDSSGQERFRSQVPNYFIDPSVAAVSVYDVTNRQSFLNISKWIEEARTERGSDVIIVLVGNKTDLVDKRQVSTEEGDSKAREFGAMIVETSAKEGSNIRLLFQSIASNIMEKFYRPSQEISSSVKSLEEIVKNLWITQQQYQQDSWVSLKNLEKTIGQLAASVEKLKAEERLPSQSET